MARTEFKDHFSTQSAGYSRFRPRYPKELFAALAELTPGRELVWDCATGTGQAAVELAEYFDRVVATDASAAQLAKAQAHPKVEYREATAEASGLEAGSVDLVTVAQALHWFDLDRFYDEVRRVVRPGGVLAVWTYNLLQITPEVDAVVRRYHDVEMEADWPPERQLVDSGYASLPFPFPKLPMPDIPMEADWTLAGLIGYLETWSAIQRYRRRTGEDPLPRFAAEVTEAWGESETRRARWPLTVWVGRCTAHEVISSCFGWVVRQAGIRVSSRRQLRRLSRRSLSWEIEWMARTDLSQELERPLDTEALDPAVRGLQPSATLLINERSRALEAEGRTIYRLGLGQSPFPVPERIVESLRRHAAEKDYLEVRGLTALRQAVAHHHESDGLTAGPEDVLIGPGSKELLFLLQLVFAGTILVPTPCWVSYLPQSRIAGRSVVTIPLSYEERWQLTADRLDETCRRLGPGRKLLVLNYPSNPVGASLSAKELEAIAEVARRHGVIVLSDEIYGRIHFRGEHVSLARFYPEGTIISSGLSKWCGAGGWRLGSFTFPRRLAGLAAAMAAVASETYTTVSAPIQYAAVEAFEGGSDLDDYLRHSRRILAAVGGRCAALLGEQEVRLLDPEGGFYLFIDLGDRREALAAAGIRTSTDLCERILQETGVAFLPGEPFGRPPEELTARLAFVNFDGAGALAASERHGLAAPLPAGFAEEACAPTVEACRRLAGWIGRQGR